MAVGKLAWEWLGFPAAIVAATVMGFNEYHVAVSAFATEKSPYLACSAVAILHFGRFLKLQKTRNLYLAAVFAGFAFLFKETAALLLPVSIAALFVSGQAGWWKRREMWLAAGLGLLVILPDLLWNVLNWDQGYGLHAGRIFGLGLTRHYFLFFGRDFLRDVYYAFGARLFDPVPEYPSMNVLWGAILLISSGFAVLKWKQLEPAGRLAAIFFWTVLVFFVSGRSGHSRFIEDRQLMVDPKAWLWVDQVLIGGSFLTAWCVTTLTLRWRQAAIGLLLVACLLSTVHVLRDRLGIPNVRMVISPSAIWPPDGRLVNVRALLLRCQICDARFRLVGTRVNRYDGKGLVLPSEDEILGATLGTADQDMRVRAAIEPSLDRKAYSFQYEVSVGDSRPQIVTPSVNVMKRIPPPPFWAQ